jgi:hypothetical protein
MAALHYLLSSLFQNVLVGAWTTGAWTTGAWTTGAWTTGACVPTIPHTSQKLNGTLLNVREPFANGTWR